MSPGYLTPRNIYINTKHYLQYSMITGIEPIIVIFRELTKIDNCIKDQSISRSRKDGLFNTISYYFCTYLIFIKHSQVLELSQSVLNCKNEIQSYYYTQPGGSYQDIDCTVC